MKRILSAALALCLILVLLPAFAVPAEAAGIADAAGSLQFANNYNPDTEEWLDDAFAVVLNLDGENYVISDLPTRNNAMSMHSLNGNNYFQMVYLTKWNDLNVFHASAKYEGEYGTYAAGTVKAGETIYVLCFNEGERQYVQTIASSVDNRRIVTGDGLSCGVPLPVLNSQYQVCGVLYGENCWSLESLLSSSTPPTTEPPATEPPATNPPATEPPATEPPATNPPATEPPATDPPADEAPDSDGGLAVQMPVELKDLDKLYEEATIQKTASKSGTVAIAVIAVLIVALAAAVVIIRRKKLQKIKDTLPEAEEGTVLDDGTVLNDEEEGTELSRKPVENNLRLQFRNGKRIAPTRSFTIGRAPDNDVVVSNNSPASGHHCEIVVQNGAVYLRDLGSTNGTYVNGKRIAAGQLVQLTPGMKVFLGGPNSSEAFLVTVSGQ